MAPFLSLALISVMIAFFGMRSVSFTLAWLLAVRADSRDSSPRNQGPRPSPPDVARRGRFGARATSPAPAPVMAPDQALLEARQLPLHLVHDDVQGREGGLLGG